MQENSEDNETPELLISFRGDKIRIHLLTETTVDKVKSTIAASVDKSLQLTTNDIKLLHKGKVLTNPETNLYDLLLLSNNNNKKTKINTKKPIRLIATGLSPLEASTRNAAFQTGLQQQAPRIRDDLTDQGRRDDARRKRLGRRTLAKAAAAASSSGKNARNNNNTTTKKCGFARIETLPMLPDQSTARSILTTLANDPGIIACMTKHDWNVGCLAELYPEGNVGRSPVCVMGLNQNKGQKILLRVRTDDLKGFRKMVSIRKVLYHELAHNVHAEHNGEFFRLMRQIERECREMDWTMGSGGEVGGVGRYRGTLEDDDGGEYGYVGGGGRLGGGERGEGGERVPVRDLAARAAMMRLSAEEEEIERHCGCGGGGERERKGMEDEIMEEVVTRLEDIGNGESDDINS